MDVVIFSTVCQLWSTISKPYIKTAYIKHFAKNVPEKMLDAFGDKMEAYQVLKIKTWSDYIDHISPNMMTAPIMYGIDDYKRRFFSLRYINLKTSQLSVVTLFQRYTDNLFFWVTCGHYNKTHLFDTSYGSCH